MTTAAVRPDRVTDLYARATVIDASIAPVMDEAQIQRMRRSGVTAVNWTVPEPWVEFDQALREIADALEIVAAHPDALLLVKAVTDLDRAKREGKVGVILGPQNALPCEAGLHTFRLLHQLGVRIMQLTYNERNAFGTGAAAADDGLTPRGREAIAEMRRVGITLDLSHCGPRTTTDAIECAEVPVLITHANAHALLPSPRNKTDEQLRLLAQRGGVIGLTLWSPMLRFDRRPDLSDFLRHVAHAIDVAGIDHVAIGTDHSEGTPREGWDSLFGSGGRYPTITGALGPWYGYDSRFATDGSSISDLPKIAAALATLGLDDAELLKVLGGNLRRVLAATWTDPRGLELTPCC